MTCIAYPDDHMPAMTAPLDKTSDPALQTAANVISLPAVRERCGRMMALAEAERLPHLRYRPTV